MGITRIEQALRTAYQQVKNTVQGYFAPDYRELEQRILDIFRAEPGDHSEMELVWRSGVFPLVALSALEELSKGHYPSLKHRVFYSDYSPTSFDQMQSPAFTRMYSLNKQNPAEPGV